MGLIQIGKSGVMSSGLEGCLDDLRRQFAREHYVRLPELFEPGLLRFIQTEIEGGEFYERVHQGIKSNKELCMKQNGAYGALLLSLNDEKLFGMIQSITQCDRIGCFEGRGHHDSWHSDMAEDRLVAMSINLSTEVYTDGTLQIRENMSERIVTEVPNVGSGDAIIFRLAPHLQHRITEVRGNALKTAFAGWFRAKPDFLSLLKGVTEPAEAAN
jgi:hypothetical protein